ncbi:hypothetical protein CCACVL1_25166 [Corchorus capsularis]|uniref:Uncharacterized protein n=1 Tax=Corchorus capsularis TaxID=210143 RepID=A0A1R3GLR0_COCAP|nr:hypothetical protein CCACVL1_25166 [Corchorus capsularis]
METGHLVGIIIVAAFAVGVILVAIINWKSCCGGVKDKTVRTNVARRTTTLPVYVNGGVGRNSTAGFPKATNKNSGASSKYTTDNVYNAFVATASFAAANSDAGAANSDAGDHHKHHHHHDGGGDGGGHHKHHHHHGGGGGGGHRQEQHTGGGGGHHGGGHHHDSGISSSGGGFGDFGGGHHHG